MAAALIHRAIGDRLTCVFVDHGLLRLNEAEQVMHTFAQNLGVKVIHVDAGAEFLVTPCVVPDVIAVAKERGVAVLPGAMTPTVARRPLRSKPMLWT